MRKKPNLTHRTSPDELLWEDIHDCGYTQRRLEKHFFPYRLRLLVLLRGIDPVNQGVFYSQ